MANLSGQSPRESVAALTRVFGVGAVVRRCTEILESGDVDAAFLIGLAGRHAEAILTGREGGVEGYWPRVWALRALLYAWDDGASISVLAATSDRSWRVREMSLKVIGRRKIEEGLPVVTQLAEDPIERVRRAAQSARSRLTT